MQSNTKTTQRSAPSLFYLLLLGSLVLLAACGSSSGSSYTSSGAPSATATTDTSATNTSGNGYGGGRYGSGGSAATPTTSSAKVQIKTTTATVNGKSETILVNEQGMTLYYRTSDSPPTLVCSGSCAGAWPPLIAKGSNAPASSTSLSGKLSVQTTANGSQVEYNGHPLYTYAADAAPGQTSGEGVGGVWHVVTPELQ